MSTHIDTGNHSNAIKLDIAVVDIHTTPDVATIYHTLDSASPSIDLAQHGYIGNTLNNPTMAIPMDMLELYRRIQMRKAGFSVEAFMKVICDMYKVCLFIQLFSAVSACLPYIADSISSSLPHSTGGNI